MRYSNIIAAATSTVWAIQEEKLESIMAFLSMKAADEVAAGWKSVGASTEFKMAQPVKGQSSEASTAIGILPVVGTISQRMNMFTEFSGGTSTDLLGQAFDSMVNDTGISAIIFDIDSPGGSVYGLDELSKKIYDARGEKPIVAVANSLAASAAYYIASAADEVIVTPGGEIGSIGTIGVHVDTSKAAEKEGLSYTLIKYGKNKGEANSLEPLSDDARDYLQDTVNKYGEMFVGAVARNRGATVSTVKKDYGQGRVFMAKDAISAGLADRIATFEQVVGEFTNRKSSRWSTWKRKKNVALQRQR